MLFPTGTVNETGVSKHQNFVLICYIGFGVFFQFQLLLVLWFKRYSCNLICFAANQISRALPEEAWVSPGKGKPNVMVCYVHFPYYALWFSIDGYAKNISLEPKILSMFISNIHIKILVYMCQKSIRSTVNNFHMIVVSHANLNQCVLVFLALTDHTVKW